MDKIFIDGFTVFARHGVHPEEAERGQRFVFDVELQVDLAPAGRSDRLADTVDYGAVTARITRVAEKRRRLLESLAEAVAADLLAEFPRIASVRLRIHKPAAPVAGAFSSLGIEITRTRSS
ncbi:MAG TPA: dihydroneopterin aldolase [Opitutaceae bacterium]|nr:dihydroneopterin aldolase [Opitutaceae bacterium]